jgi:hypothetical protein
MPFHCQHLQLPPRFAFDHDEQLVDPSAVIVLGTPMGGLTGLTRGWLSLSADLSEQTGDGGPVPSTVRVATASRTLDNHAAWLVHRIVLDATTARFPLPLPQGCDKVSVGRVDAAGGLGATTPIGITLEMD